MVNKVVEENVRVLWNFMRLNETLKVSDCILGLGCHDISVAERCAMLYLEGFGQFVIFSGGLGKITEKIWHETEAEKFADTAINLGVPSHKVYIENNSTNTGDNLILTKKLIENKNLPVSSLIVVTKPTAERRIRAAFEKRMPEYSAICTSPQISFEEYMKRYENGPVAQEEMINALVGDIQRFDIYYKKGFQVYVKVPDSVLLAYKQLIDFGFNKYLIK